MAMAIFMQGPLLFSSICFKISTQKLAIEPSELKNEKWGINATM